MNTIAQNLQSVHLRVAAACEQAGRDRRSVHLLAVSKTFGPDAVRDAADAGQRDFGENYIQEAVEKIIELRTLRVGGEPLQWHCIGPVQSNKTRLVAEHFDWVHTLDRVKIAQRLSEQRPRHLPPLQVCVQVNVMPVANKSGVSAPLALELAQAVAQLPGLELRGLMCMPDPIEVDGALDVRTTQQLFEAVASLAPAFARSLPTGLRFDTLSMGMSADLEPAIAAGATVVRVGSAIFGRRSMAQGAFE